MDELGFPVVLLFLPLHGYVGEIVGSLCCSSVGWFWGKGSSSQVVSSQVSPMNLLRNFQVSLRIFQIWSNFRVVVDTGWSTHSSLIAIIDGASVGVLLGVPHCSSTRSSSCFFCWRRNLWEEAWSSTPVLWIERRARLNNQGPSKLGLLESRRLDHLSRSSESNEGPGRATKNPTRLAFTLPFECHYSR